MMLGRYTTVQLTEILAIEISARKTLEKQPKAHVMHTLQI